MVVFSFIVKAILFASTALLAIWWTEKWVARRKAEALKKAESELLLAIAEEKRRNKRDKNKSVLWAKRAKDDAALIRSKWGKRS